MLGVDCFHIAGHLAEPAIDQGTRLESPVGLVVVGGVGFIGQLPCTDRDHSGKIVTVVTVPLGTAEHACQLPCKDGGHSGMFVAVVLVSYQS
jgi:hypothetical protein